jgi:hypothetical protein
MTSNNEPINFLDINRIVYLCEYCDIQVINLLSCVCIELRNNNNTCLKKKKIYSVHLLNNCFNLYYGTSYDNIYIYYSDLLNSYIKTNIVNNITNKKSQKGIIILREIAEIFNTYYCNNTTKILINNKLLIFDESFHYRKKLNIIKIFKREKTSPMFLQSLGWACKPRYILKWLECYEKM